MHVFDVLDDLKLTWEVRDGIRAHTWRIDPPPATPEALCVRYADRIAYLTHDALDALRAGMLSAADFPSATRRRLGEPGRRWIGEMISSVIEESARVGAIRMAADLLDVMHELREFMFERVYLAEENLVHKESCIGVLRRLVDHHLAHPEELPSSYRDNDAALITQVVDYVTGMTDRFALATHDRLFRPALEPAV